MNKAILLFGLFLFVGLFACAPHPERGPMTPKAPPPTGKASLFPQENLEKKIGFLNQLLERQELSPEDSDLAEALLMTYESVRNIPEEAVTDAEYRKSLETLYENLTAIDERYFRSCSASHLPADLKKKILESYLSEDYDAVITHTLDLKEVFGPDALIPEIALPFALSLGKEGLLEEAIRIGKRVASQLEGKPDIIRLLAGIAVWEHNLGRREDSIQTYKTLAKMLDERNAIARNTETALRSAPAKASAKAGTEGQAQGDLDQLLASVDQLVRERRFAEARALLVFERDRAKGTDDVAVIDRTLSELDGAQERYLEDRLSMISEKQETVDLVKRLLEEEKFEDAISRIETLEKDHQLDQETSDLKEQAIEGLISKERNLAAKSFLLAKQTSDPIERKKYLRECYERLQALVEKYPSAPSSEKLRSNLKRVQEEMERL